MSVVCAILRSPFFLPNGNILLNSHTHLKITSCHCSFFSPSVPTPPSLSHSLHFKKNLFTSSPFKCLLLSQVSHSLSLFQMSSRSACLKMHCVYYGLWKFNREKNTSEDQGHRFIKGQNFVLHLAHLATIIHNTCNNCQSNLFTKHLRSWCAPLMSYNCTYCNRCRSHHFKKDVFLQCWSAL